MKIVKRLAYTALWTGFGLLTAMVFFGHRRFQGAAGRLLAGPGECDRLRGRAVLVSGVGAVAGVMAVTAAWTRTGWTDYWSKSS